MRLSRLGIFALVASATLAGSAPQALAQAPDGMPVTVAKPVARKVTESGVFTGRFQASATVEVRARVSGYLDKASFVEGGLVKAGDLLFTIDARPFQAAVAQAEAQLQAAQTRLDLARTNLNRAEELRKTGNVTDANYQAQSQAFLEATANLDASKAALETAKLDLEFSQVKAPISGRIGRKLVTEGNLVVGGTQGSGTLLTTIVGVDPIYFYFDMDESTALKFTRMRQNGGTTEDVGKEKLGVKVALPDESGFNHAGTIDYVDPQIDAATGTLTVRAVLANPDGVLTPGLFGRLIAPIGQPFDAMILPAEAVGLSSQGDYVLTVGADGTVAPKPVVTGPKFGAFRSIRSGLTADDTVIVNGLMRARPGGKVAPKPTELKVPDELVPDAGSR